MEDKDSVIAKLKEKIEEQDKDIYHAAVYGKQLIEDKEKLSVKIDELLGQKELLEQEKHSLQLDLETKVQALHSQTNEVEYQRDRADSLQEKIEASDRENGILHKKMENIKKENQYLKKLQDDFSIENTSLKDKLTLLEKQMKNFEDQAEKSLCEVDKNETQELQLQLTTYMLNNKELQQSLSKTQSELEATKKNEKQLLQMIRELEEALAERGTELSACNVEIKAAKEEIEELKAEIEVLKFDQIDVKRRGNSVFAELDDRRHLVEKEYKILRKKFEEFQKTYEENKKELDRLRAQMVILQNTASRDYQQTYINQLEDSLSAAKEEISELTLKLSKAVKSNAKLQADKRSPEKVTYEYMRVMLKQSQKKEKDLQRELSNVRMKNMYDNDKLNETQRFLYKTREDLDSAKLEILTLKQKIKDLETGIILNQPTEPVIRKPKIEILEGFTPSITKENEEKKINLNASLFIDPDIIPGELELGEDGFKQVKPSRKSNRWILKDMNTIKPENDNEEDNLKCSKKKSDLTIDSKLKTTISDPKEMESKQVMSQSRIASKRKDDNCTHQ